MSKRERWEESKHPRNPRNGRFIRKRVPLPVGGASGATRSFGIGRGRWPVEATVDIGPGSGRKQAPATVGARVRFRNSKRDIAVGVIANAAPIRKRLARAKKKSTQSRKAKRTRGGKS